MVKSKAAQRATATWEAKAYDKVLVRLPKGIKEQIQATGETVNGFINKAVVDRLKEFEDKDKGPGA